MPPLSVIILTFNEEANLPAALDSLKAWAEEVFVVDSYSTDRTVEIALERKNDGVRVVQHVFQDYSRQWNWALEHLPVSQPWVMKLDADERATEDFRDEVTARITSPDTRETGFVVHWRPVFMGRRLRWGGVYPNGNLRIWSRGRARAGRRAVNEHLHVDGAVGQIHATIDHYDFKSLTHWIDRHNRYSSMEAGEMESAGLRIETPPQLFGQPYERRMWLRRVYNSMPARPFLYFLYCYFLRLGFLDGRVGFRYCFLRSTFFYWIDLKYAEFVRTGHTPELIWPARGQPHPAIAGSPLQRMVDEH
jgi:glycosyltransferase involved in cell wall biosynthesis